MPLIERSSLPAAQSPAPLAKLLSAPLLVLCVAVPGTAARAAAPTHVSGSRAGITDARQALPPLDIPFVKNRGEVDARVALYASTKAGTLFVAHDGELTYVLPARQGSDRARQAGWALKQRMSGARPLAVTGGEPTGVMVRHIRQSAPAGASAVSLPQPTYRWADLGEAWRGITVRIRAAEGVAEQFFTVAPGADAQRIRIELKGSRHLATGPQGGLEVDTGVGVVRFSAPAAWQDIGGERRAVAVHYGVQGRDAYGFVLGRHDPAHEVIIDPLLQATYLGGSGPGDGINAMTVDPTTGDLYVAGRSASTAGFPVSAGALQTTRAGTVDAFVARLPADLKNFTEVTYLGGLGVDEATSIAVNPGSGDVYVAGISDSTERPGLTGGAVSAAQAGYPAEGAFIARLDASLASLRQSTAYGAFLGGGGFLTSGGFSPGKVHLTLAVNATSGEVYLAGEAGTTGSPAYSSGLFGTAGGAIATFTGQSAGFVARFSADLKTFLQATYITGSNTSVDGQANGASTSVSGIVIEPVSGDLLITGTSNCATLPVTNGAFQVARDPLAAWTGYVARMPKNLGSFLAFSYMTAGSTNPISETDLQSVALSPGNGDVYVAGETNGDLLAAAAGGYQSTIPAIAPMTTPPANAQAELIARIAPDLTALRQTTYFYDGQLGYGGYYHIGVNTRNYALAIAPGGDVFTVGLACPGTSGGAQPSNRGSVDLCIARFAPDLRSLVQSTFLGGSGKESNGSLAISSSAGDLYVGGSTASADFPGTTGGAQPAFAAGASANGFIARLSSDLAGTVQAGSLQFSAATYAAADNSGAAVIVVTRTGGGSGAVSVSFATGDGTGKAGIDYSATTQTVSFADGDTAAKTVSIPIKVNTTVAGNETVNLTLSNVSGGATLGSPAAAILTIIQTSSPVTPPPATLTVTGKSGGGALDILDLIALALVVIACRLRIRKWPARSAVPRRARCCSAVIVMAICAAPIVAGLAVRSASAAEPDGYTGVSLGRTQSQSQARDLERMMGADGFPGTTVTLDDHRLGGKLFVGLGLNPYFSVEAAYVDLNKVRTRVVGRTPDARGFLDTVERVLPYSARGAAVTAVASLPIGSRLSLFGRGGAFAWHGEIDANLAGQNTVSTTKTSVSGIVGGGMELALTRRIALRGEWERYFIARDAMDLASIGIKVGFR